MFHHGITRATIWWGNFQLCTLPEKCFVMTRSMTRTVTLTHQSLQSQSIDTVPHTIFTMIVQTLCVVSTVMRKGLQYLAYCFGTIWHHHCQMMVSLIRLLVLGCSITSEGLFVCCVNLFVVCGAVVPYLRRVFLWLVKFC